MTYSSILWVAKRPFTEYYNKLPEGTTLIPLAPGPRERCFTSQDYAEKAAHIAAEARGRGVAAVAGTFVPPLLAALIAHRAYKWVWLGRDIPILGCWHNSPSNFMDFVRIGDLHV